MLRGLSRLQITSHSLPCRSESNPFPNHQRRHPKGSVAFFPSVERPRADSLGLVSRHTTTPTDFRWKPVFPIIFGSQSVSSVTRFDDRRLRGQFSPDRGSESLIGEREVQRCLSKDDTTDRDFLPFFTLSHSYFLLKSVLGLKSQRCKIRQTCCARSDLFYNTFLPPVTQTFFL